MLYSYSLSFQVVFNYSSKFNYPGLHGPGVKSTIIIGVAIARYIALPLFGATIVKGAIHLGLVHPDPLYQFILLLQHAVPPAMNIGNILTTPESRFLLAFN